MTALKKIDNKPYNKPLQDIQFHKCKWLKNPAYVLYFGLFVGSGPSRSDVDTH